MTDLDGPRPDPYLLANRAVEAEDRFGALASCFDGATFASLASIGVASGWRCWEVGAGGPTVAAWLSGRVDPTGSVVATDIDSTWLSPAPPRVDVRVHDVAVDEPPGRAFELVHARLVLTHVPERDRALEAMAGSLAPGGWLVIEDFDVEMGIDACPDPQGEIERRANRIRSGFVALLAARGVDLRFGRTLPRRLRALGLVDLRAEARFPVVGSATRQLERANTAQVAAGLVAAGHASTTEIDAHLASLDDPDQVLDIASPPLFTVSARRPRPGDLTRRPAATDRAV